MTGPGWRRRSPASRAALVAALAAGAAPAAAEGGRLVEVSAGATVAARVGDRDPPPVPGLLRHPPELQIGWGLRLGDGAVLLTRLDLLGAMIPIGPSGVGLDLVAGWCPGLRRPGWAPVVRGAVGGVVLGSGGEAGGPDHASRGFRLGAEAGAVHRRRVPAGWAGWGVLVGGQVTALVTVEPCSPAGDCDAVLAGVTARLEAHLLF